MLQGVSFLDSNNINGHRCNPLTTVSFSLADVSSIKFVEKTEFIIIIIIIIFAHDTYINNHYRPRDGG